VNSCALLERFCGGSSVNWQKLPLSHFQPLNVSRLSPEYWSPIIRPWQRCEPRLKPQESSLRTEIAPECDCIKSIGRIESHQASSCSGSLLGASKASHEGGSWSRNRAPTSWRLGRVSRVAPLLMLSDEPLESAGVDARSPIRRTASMPLIAFAPPVLQPTNRSLGWLRLVRKSRAFGE
jgi:hypothetical protein